MIDYFFKFTNEAAATADADGTAFYRNGSWNPDRVVPDVKVWRASQDVNGTDAQGNPTITHTYLPGWFCIISINRQLPALINHTALQLALDRDEFNGGRAGVIKRNVTVPILQDIRFQPIFAGSNYPFGAMS